MPPQYAGLRARSAALWRSRATWPPATSRTRPGGTCRVVSPRVLMLFNRLPAASAITVCRRWWPRPLWVMRAGPARPASCFCRMMIGGRRCSRGRARPGPARPAARPPPSPADMERAGGRRGAQRAAGVGCLLPCGQPGPGRDGNPRQGQRAACHHRPLPPDPARPSKPTLRRRTRHGTGYGRPTTAAPVADRTATVSPRPAPVGPVATCRRAPRPARRARGSHHRLALAWYRSRQRLVRRGSNSDGTGPSLTPSKRHRPCK